MALYRLFVPLAALSIISTCIVLNSVSAEEKSDGHTARNVHTLSGNTTNAIFYRAANRTSAPNFDSNMTAEPDKGEETQQLDLESPSQQSDITTEFPSVDKRGNAHKIQATIINPFRSAAVAAEVGGIIEEYNFEIGDLVPRGATVLAISKKRYDLAVQKARQNLDALQLALKRAQRDKEIKERLVTLDAGTLQDLLKAQTEVEVIESKIREGEITLKQTLVDLEACQVKAPFTGHVAVRYKELFEAAAPLEKLFALIDSSKVYAVAYVPEDSMQYFKKGAKAAFNDSEGTQFVGEVEKIEPIIDPKTGSQKVFVLMDNAEAHLRVGMTGSLESVE